MDIAEYSWKTYLKMVLETNVLEDDEIEWGIAAIWNILKSNDITKKGSDIFRSMIYLNKTIRISCFAFTFTQNLRESLQNRDVNKLYETLITDTPEFNSSHLTHDEKKMIQDVIKTEKIILNKYITGCLSCAKYSNKQLLSKCVLETLELSGINKTLIPEEYHVTIRVADNGFTYSYTIDELLCRIYDGDINHYTQEPFSEELVNTLNEHYPTSLKLVKIYREQIL